MSLPRLGPGSRRTREADPIVPHAEPGDPGAGAAGLAALAEYRRRVRVRVVASRVTLVLAVVGLLSATLRGVWRDAALYRDVLPGLVPETARPSLVAVSIALLLTARGLRRGSRLAWAGAVAVLTLSVVLHLARGLDVVAAVLVAAAVAWLVLRRDAFPVLPPRRAVRHAALVTAGFLLALLLVVGGSTAWFLTRPGTPDVESARTWLAPVGFVLNGAFVAVLLWSLLSPRRPPRESPAEHRAARERARDIVRRHGSGTLDYFALRDDKDWFVVEDTVVAYAVRGGVALVSPDPIGPADRRELAWAEFLGQAASFGWSVAVVAAARPWLPVYEASGLRTVYLGDEAVVDCTTFTLAGSAHKSLRQAVNRVARAGYTTTFHDPTALDPALREALAEMSGESRRGDVERGFSMTLSRLADPADTGLMLSVTRTADGRVDAFCQWVPASAIGGWSLDVMRRRTDRDDLPNGLVDATVAATIAELARRGERGLGLNFAVLREVMEGERDARMDPLVRPVLQRLSAGTQLTTLSSFNEKFDPAWVPRYLVLDSAEYVAAQALAVAGAEGVSEVPVIGRFLRAGGAS